MRRTVEGAKSRLGCFSLRSNNMLRIPLGVCSKKEEGQDFYRSCPSSFFGEIPLDGGRDRPS